jgi:transcriptional regulator GlxA family with amidase domain
LCAPYTAFKKNILARLTQILEDCNLKGRERNSLLALDLAYLYYYFVHILDNNYYISHMAIKRNSSKIQAVVNYISANYVLDLKVSELAKKFSFSHNNLIYHFRKELNMSPIEFITFQRLQAAKNLLQNTDYTVTQIASLCGFAHPSFFGKVFQQHEGISPSEYRKKNTL